MRLSRAARRARTVLPRLALTLPLAACGAAELDLPLDTDEAALCSLESEDLTCEPGPGERAYLHPLAARALPDGRVPLVDVKDLDGQRYAVVDRLTEGTGGQLSRSSTVELLPQRRLTAAQRQALVPAKIAANGGVAPDRSSRAQPKVGASLAAALAEAPAGTRVPVALRFVDPAPEPLIHALERAIGQGRVRSLAERHDIRAELLASRRAALAAARGALDAALADLGAEVTYRCENMACLNARLTAGQVAALAQRVEVERLDLEAPGADEVDGADVVDGSQITQFIDAGYDGENLGDPYDITGAVIETEGLLQTHDTFFDWSGSDDRLREGYDCDSSGCVVDATYGAAGSHPMAVAGILMGDVRDGQDSAVTDPTDRIEKSGYSGESRLYFYHTDSNTGAKSEAFDHVVSRAVTPHAVNLSWGSESNDPDCLGQSTFSKDANDLFESGILLFKSAGNEGNSDASDCTVTSPGSAIGVFTVGAIGDGTSGDEDDVRTDAIRSTSSRGGVSLADGVNRTIVDLTAYGCRDNLPDTAGGYTTSGCGTSYAAPTVAAAALNFVDAYKHLLSDLIDEPGVLFASMLLMGDRQAEAAGSVHISQFNELYGAGRLQMRLPDDSGMDAPSQWGFGYTCVDDGQTVTLTINGGAALSADVDDLKAVAYWYDPRHESGDSVSDVDLYLKTTGGSTLRSSLDSYDEKERVFYSGVGGQAVKLELYGYDVPSDSTGCGNNSVKVYYAWFYEDDDRDDANGPSSEIDPE